VRAASEELDVADGVQQGFSYVKALSMQTVEAVFNAHNVWISRVDPDPSILRYDMEVGDEWSAFFTPKMTSIALPRLARAERLDTGPHTKHIAGMQRSIEEQIYAEIALRIQDSRVGMPTWINKSEELAKVLKIGLELKELTRLQDEEASIRLAEWTKEVKSALPAESAFIMRIVNYSYVDAKRIRKHLLSNTDYAQRQDDGTEFALAVRCFIYHGRAASAWVCFALLDIDLLS